jgi:hypothetical protein
MMTATATARNLGVLTASAKDFVKKAFAIRWVGSASVGGAASS